MADLKQGDDIRNRPVKLYVPLDASLVDGFKPGQNVQVVVRDDAGALQSVMVQMDKGGKGSAEFSFKKTPGALTIAMGPENVAKEDIFGLQTINLSVSARQWLNNKELRLTPVIISDYYWHWWLRWCRTFTITGRVLCHDGSPVPGAVVTAFDVDAWWWWMSKQKVGSSVVTDITGSFRITFKWCCGWWPWWWWRIRHWELEPAIAERIHKLYYREPLFPRPPLPDPEPNLEIFKKIIGNEEFASLNIGSKDSVAPLNNELKTMGSPVQVRKTIDPGILEPFRKKLLNQIPESMDLKRFRIWPWWKWQPWWDCTPDIIFRVTQHCHSAKFDDVIVDEDYFDARWDIPTNFNVTLVANEKACCIETDPTPPLEGICQAMTSVCSRGIDQIGGNSTAPPTPVGYYNPGVWDQPFSEYVWIQGEVGSDVHYYAFELTKNNGLNWNLLDISAISAFSRRYFDSGVFSPYINFLHTIDGIQVYESRHHYEDHNDQARWGLVRFWTTDNLDTLLVWNTLAPFLNGDYQLRLVGWQLDDKTGKLINRQILKTCGKKVYDPLMDTIKLKIDNRLVGAASGHPPYTPDHPCGPGTVHLCTMEPDTNFLDVKILHADNSEMQIDACKSHSINDTDRLQIDFFAYDEEGHLLDFSVIATWGINQQSQDLAQIPGALTSLPGGGGGVPAALQVGPNYTTALSDSPTSPKWCGGAMRLTVLAYKVFPETCCYQLELRARKRTIVNCWGEPYRNLSEYSFMITV